MEFKIYINDIEYKTSDNYSITQQSGSVSNSTIDVLVLDGQVIPQSLMKVEILDENDNIFFCGIIESVQSPEFSTTYEVRRYRLNINSLETIFNNRLVSDAFEEKYTHEIVQTLFTNYIEEENVTLGYISPSEQLYSNFNCSFTKLYDVLTELAEDVNGSFYISSDKKFYFISREMFNNVEIPERITNLSFSENSSDMRNIQVVNRSK